MSASASDLAKELSSLASISVTSKPDLDIWYHKSEELHKRLHSIYAHLYDSLPHEIEHYLADADIRFKDSEYSASQQDFIRNLISNLESGKITNTA